MLSKFLGNKNSYTITLNAHFGHRYWVEQGGPGFYFAHIGERADEETGEQEVLYSRSWRCRWGARGFGASVVQELNEVRLKDVRLKDVRLKDVQLNDIP
jgi:hypothetical protein